MNTQMTIFNISKDDITIDTAIAMLTFNSIGKSKKEQVRNFKLIEIISQNREYFIMNRHRDEYKNINEMVNALIENAKKNLATSKNYTNNYIYHYDKSKSIDFTKKIENEITFIDNSMVTLNKFVDYGILESFLLNDMCNTKLVSLLDSYQKQRNKLVKFVAFANQIKEQKDEIEL